MRWEGTLMLVRDQRWPRRVAEVLELEPGSASCELCGPEKMTSLCLSFFSCKMAVAMGC